MYSNSLWFPGNIFMTRLSDISISHKLRFFILMKITNEVSLAMGLSYASWIFSLLMLWTCLSFVNREGFMYTMKYLGHSISPCTSKACLPIPKFSLFDFLPAFINTINSKGPIGQYYNRIDLTPNRRIVCARQNSLSTASASPSIFAQVIITPQTRLCPINAAIPTYKHETPRLLSCTFLFLYSSDTSQWWNGVGLLGTVTGLLGFPAAWVLGVIAGTDSRYRSYSSEKLTRCCVRLRSKCTASFANGQLRFIYLEMIFVRGRDGSPSISTSNSIQWNTVFG